MNNPSPPKEWAHIKIGDVLDYGTAQKATLSDVNDNTWVLELEDIEKDTSRLLNKITAKDRKFKSSKNIFKKGDVLYGKLRPYLNKVIIANDDGVCSTEIIPLDGTPYINNQFLFYWLKSDIFKNYANNVSYGVNMPRLGTKGGISAPFLLPPIAEQNHIAEQLNLLFAKINLIKSSIDKIPGIISEYNKSILSSAINGDLLNENKTHASWNESALKDVTLKIGSGSTPKGGSRAYKESGIPFIRSLNIYTTHIKYDDLVYIDNVQAEKLKNVEVFDGDLLLNITGASIGRVNIAPADFVGGRVNQHVAIIRCNEKVLNPKYLHILLSSPSIQSWIENENYGATRQALTKKMLEELVINYPTLNIQNKIVEHVTYLSSKVKTLEVKAKNILDNLSKLNSLILSKAFSGELSKQWRLDHSDSINGHASSLTLLSKIKKTRKLNKSIFKKNISHNKKGGVMTKITKDHIYQWISSTEKSKFTFEDIQISLNTDYDSLKECLFEALNDSSPLFNQYFDEDARKIVFIKAEK